MRYKKSKYNYFIVVDGNYYVYNLISGAILKTSPDLSLYLRNNDSFDSRLFSDSLLAKLKKSGTIIDYDFDEIEYLRFIYNKDKYDDSYLSVVMLPTLQCNLRCHYCYEKDKKEQISSNSLRILSAFFKKQSERKKHIAVRWSGGEMMLQWENIKILSEDIIQNCKANGCEYHASCVTNATLLKESRIKQFRSIGIKSVQITLDGSEEYHNKVRHYPNGRGTFKDIISNIAITSKYLKVIIRLNIDKLNIKDIERLFLVLNELDINKNNIQLFCKPVVCTQVRKPKNQIYTHQEFYQTELHLIKLAEKYNLPYSFHWGIRGKHIRCSYNNLQGFYITPGLKVYKCPIYVDNSDDNNSHIVGYISESGSLIFSNFKELNHCLNYSPFDNNEYLKCKVLPICFGKCIPLWEMSGKKADEGCIPDKFSFLNKINYALKSDIEYIALLRSGIL